MNKEQLKLKWSKYTDTDKLVDDICALYTKYGHSNTEYGVCVQLDAYFTNKEPLIQLLQKSQHYCGDMRIKIPIKLIRQQDRNGIARFCTSFDINVEAKKAICSYIDGDGKGIHDYIKTGVKSMNIYHLPNTENARINMFRSDGVTVASYNKFIEFKKFMNLFKDICTPTISNNMGDTVKITAGMKTSRAFNKICEEYGVSKMPNYNRLFAQYSDMVNGLERTYDFIISVNPYDYLTMSFGNSWASCHTIDKRNVRGMANSYSGSYCGGTLSYMLDGTSIITYVIHTDGNVQTDGKIYRCMFHYDEKLVQGRVYPQSNDSNTCLYDIFRGVVQYELSNILNIENKWQKFVSTSQHTNSTGVHYTDYLHFAKCNVSVPTEQHPSPAIVKIGSKGICPKCGKEITVADRLTHITCPTEV